MEDRKGKLYLIPNLIAPGDPALGLPGIVLERLRALRRFVVEGEKAAWRLLSLVLSREALAEVRLEVLDEHTPAEDLPRLLEPVLTGEDLGILSEAGLPCVADPGSALVALAHDRGIRVVPLLGPSSLLLALAASGLDGQRFSFLGYLPADPEGRRRALQEIDRGVRSDGATRILIETPYRNDRLLEDCLRTLSPETRLAVARGIGGPEESVHSRSVAAWRASLAAEVDPGKARIGKEPTVFLIGCVPGTSLDRPAGFGHSGGNRCRKPKR